MTYICLESIIKALFSEKVQPQMFMNFKKKICVHFIFDSKILLLLLSYFQTFFFFSPKSKINYKRLKQCLSSKKKVNLIIDIEASANTIKKKGRKNSQKSFSAFYFLIIYKEEIRLKSMLLRLMPN